MATDLFSKFAFKGFNQPKSCRSSSECVSSDEEDYSEAETTTKSSSPVQQIVEKLPSNIWTEKYAPKHITEIVGNNGPLNQLVDWLKNWHVDKY